MPEFSVLTPVYVYNEDRQKMLKRCFDSVLSQTQEDWEHVIVNDGSPCELAPLTDERQVVIDQEHLDRLFGYNTAMKHARGEWFCFLDSDDEYLSYYLEAASQVIQHFPQYKLFNFASLHCHRGYDITIKPAFRPSVKDVGHEVFRSGGIVNGTFIFHRSLYEELGGFPEVTNCWDLATEAYKLFPEIKPLFARVNAAGETVYPEIGNPFGQDYFYFYKLTRKYHSKPIDIPVYLVHPKQGHHLKQT